MASYFWAHICRDWGGSPHPPDQLRSLECDHIREAPTMGLEPPSKPEHLVAICRYAHQSSGWATANRPLLRAYLALVMTGVRPNRRTVAGLRPMMRIPRGKEAG